MWRGTTLAAKREAFIAELLEDELEDESVVFLNDSVEIERGVFSNCDNEKLVVYARPGSTAEQYALSNGIKCAPLFANAKESD